MGYNRNILKSLAFKNLPPDKQREYFSLTEKKFLPCIDNIYYSCFIKNDNSNNPSIAPLLQELADKKMLVTISHEELEFFNGLLLSPGGFKIYKYRLVNPDLYDIFILDYLPNVDTPRILVQLRAYGLWVFGVEKMLIDSFNSVNTLLNDYFDSSAYINTIERCRENRIDYCYHTNIITNPHKEFSDQNLEKKLCTIFNSFGNRGHIEKFTSDKQRCNLVKDYFSLGERKSNNVFVRIYNKGLEVVELGYKSFFLEYWYKNGLINFYDRYCYEYAYENRDFNYIHKARLMFYIDYCKPSDTSVCTSLLNSENATWVDYKVLADKYLPPVTTIINVEFETKRKFYYYSDDFIDSLLQTAERSDVPYPLQRIFKIVDNRGVFLDYLTSKTLSFKKLGSDEYVPWWQRLRTCKLDGLKADDKLLRDYSKSLDNVIVTKRAINAVGTAALYSGLIDCDFKADISDLLSNVNDNTINYMDTYDKNKKKHYKRLKNRL